MKDNSQASMSEQVSATASARIPAIRREGAVAIVVTDLGAPALGALVVGSISIGGLAIGRLALGRGRVRGLEIDELRIARVIIDKPRVERASGRCK